MARLSSPQWLAQMQVTLSVECTGKVHLANRLCVVVRDRLRHRGSLTPNVAFWLKADLQSPEIDFRLSPSFGHFGQGWEGLKLTRSRRSEQSLGMLVSLSPLASFARRAIDHEGAGSARGRLRGHRGPGAGRYPWPGARPSARNAEIWFCVISWPMARTKRCDYRGPLALSYPYQSFGSSDLARTRLRSSIACLRKSCAGVQTLESNSLNQRSRHAFRVVLAHGTAHISAQSGRQELEVPEDHSRIQCRPPFLG